MNSLDEILKIIEEIADIIEKKEKIHDEDFIKHMSELDKIFSEIPSLRE